jgi:hypothetical protein
MVKEISSTTLVVRWYCFDVCSSLPQRSYAGFMDWVTDKDDQFKCNLCAFSSVRYSVSIGSGTLTNFLGCLLGHYFRLQTTHRTTFDFLYF